MGDTINTLPYKTLRIIQFPSVHKYIGLLSLFELSLFGGKSKFR